MRPCQMTDNTTELDTLRAKNAELLSELKGVKAKLREKLEADTTTADKLAAVTKELTSIKTASTLENAWMSAGILPSMAKYAAQECRYDLAVDDSGEIVAIEKETGERIDRDDKGHPATAAEVMHLAFADMRTTHNQFFGISVGSGAMGSDTTVGHKRK